MKALDRLVAQAGREKTILLHLDFILYHHLSSIKKTRSSLSQALIRLWIWALLYLVWRRQADMYCGVHRRLPVRRLHMCFMCFCLWLLFFRYRYHKHWRRLGEARGAVACAFPLLLYTLVTCNPQNDPETQQRNPERERTTVTLHADGKKVLNKWSQTCWDQREYSLNWRKESSHGSSSL